jgi:hypothetical protein
MIRFLKSCHRDEAGTSLVLALVFLSILGVGSAALISFGATSEQATVAVRNQANAVYAAEGAVRAAVQSTRSLGLGYTCPLSIPLLNIGGVIPTVVCTPLAGIVGSRVNPDTATNTPPNAIMTLAGLTGGLGVTNKAVTVSGSIYGNGTLTGPITLINGGTGVAGVLCLNINPCNLLLGPPQTDPGVGANAAAYAPMTKPTQTAIAPTCTGGVTPTFVPQIFTVAPTAGACPGTTLVFTPGAYYFNLGAAWSPALKVIGGTLASDGRTCDATKPGVQFQFGGATQLLLANNRSVRLCADPTNPAKAQIAIFGMRGTDAGWAAQSGCVTAVLLFTCTFLDTQSAANVDLEVSGTVYAPGAQTIHLDLNTNGTTSVTRGMVNQALTLGAPVVTTTAIVSVPGTSPTIPSTNRVALFTAALTPGSPVKLQAVVQFDDSILLSPGAAVTFQSWSVHR